MKTIQVIIIIFFSLLVTSCDDNTTIVEGYVIHSGTKKPLDSVLVVLQDGIANGGGMFPTGPSNTAGDGSQSVTYTNKNGYFKVTLDGESPYLWIKKGRFSWYYKQEGALVGVRGFKPGSNYNIELEMDAEAFFNPTFLSKKLVNPHDTLGIDDLGYFIYTGQQYVKYGPLTVIGDKYHKFELYINRDGIKESIIDSVYILSFTTYTDTIYY
jgi:hypothetical protein